MEGISQWTYTIEATQTVAGYDLKSTNAPLDIVDNVSPYDDGDTIFNQDIFMIMYYVLAAGVLLCCILAHVYIFQRRRNDRRTLVYPRRMSNSYEKADLSGNKPLTSHTKLSEQKITSTSGATKSPGNIRGPPLAQRSLSLPNGSRGVRESTVYESIEDIMPQKPKYTRSLSQHCIKSFPVECNSKSSSSKIPQPQTGMPSKLPFHGRGKRSTSIDGTPRATFQSHHVITERHHEASSNRDFHASKHERPVYSLPTSNTGELYEVVGITKPSTHYASGPVRINSPVGHFNAQTKFTRGISEHLHKSTSSYVDRLKPTVPPKPEGRSRSIVRKSLSDLHKLRQTHEDYTMQRGQNGNPENAKKQSALTSTNLPDVVCETTSSAVTNYVYNTLCLPKTIVDQQPPNVNLSLNLCHRIDTTSPMENKENYFQEGPYDILDHGFSLGGRRVSQDETRAKKKATNRVETSFHHETHVKGKTKKHSHIFPDHKINKVHNRSILSEKKESPIYFTLEPNNLQSTLNPCHAIFEDERQGKRDKRAFMRSQSTPLSPKDIPSDSEIGLDEPFCTKSRNLQKFRYRKADSRQNNRKSVIDLHAIQDELM